MTAPVQTTALSKHYDGTPAVDDLSMTSSKPSCG